MHDAPISSSRAEGDCGLNTLTPSAASFAMPRVTHFLPALWTGLKKEDAAKGERLELAPYSPHIWRFVSELSICNVSIATAAHQRPAAGVIAAFLIGREAHAAGIVLRYSIARHIRIPVTQPAP